MASYDQVVKILEEKDEEAAKWFTSKYFSNDYVGKEVDINSMFSWSASPKGHYFWSGVYSEVDRANL